MDASTLQLISWNVAGWASLNELVCRHYSGLQEYLQKLGQPAIFCAQEVKVQDKDLKSEMAARKLGAVIPGYRSYWSFSDKRGSRGVATWVREDLVCLGATQKVFGDPEIDQLGRALLTDHGSFAVLNVYAPFVGAGDGRSGELKTKIRFLEALQRRMGELRARGKRVVLCGDMNLTHRLVDQKPGRRLLWVDSQGFLDVPTLAAEAKVDVSLTEVTHQGGHGTSDVLRLGPFEDLAGRWVPVSDMCERTNVPKNHLESTGECLHMRDSSCVKWLRSLVAQAAHACDAPAWADVFAEVHPDAQDRFTSWGQSANLRYINCGTRIDYIIVDRGTFDECVVKSPSSYLRGANASGCPQELLATTAQAAANAATNFGAWHGTGAQGDGLSLQSDNMKLNESQFPEKLHTGLLYTPPSYSDHIPVTALFLKELLEQPRGEADAPQKLQLPSVASDSETKQSQPWKAQRSIASFFSAAATPKAAGTQAVGECATPESKVRLPTRIQGTSTPQSKKRRC